jgi:SH3 domain-containing YSC84-like protein 1
MRLSFIKTLIGGLSLLLALSVIGHAQYGGLWDSAVQSDRAAWAFARLMNTPDRRIPRSILDRARCVAVFPWVWKAGFVVGGRWGRGVASCRTKLGWSAPAFFNMTGGSVGPQIGAQATDFVLLFMGERGMNRLLLSRFEIGGEGSFAAGPIGREVGAATDLSFGSRILSYSRSRGLFAGMELKGAVIARDESNMISVYGLEISAWNVLRGAVPAPYPVQNFPATLSRYSRRRIFPEPRQY